jgi:uncharacterized protein (TIGR02147 family)
MEIYNHKNYKTYLNVALTNMGEERGLRKKMAIEIGCQSSFLSQVLNGDVNFSLEHSAKINKFFGHDEKESEYFILLVLMERAGSIDLKDHFEKQIEKILKERLEIKERIKSSNDLSSIDYVLYYSQWYYAAIHILCAIPEFENERQIADKLNLPIEIVKKALNFLIEKNLVSLKKGKLSIGKARIHIDRKSPLFIQHNTNWKIEAIKALEQIKHDSLHYSGVLALSKVDYKAIKEIYLRAIEQSEAILKDSPEEVLISVSMDLFEV